MTPPRLHTAEFLDAVKTIQSRGVSRDQAWDIAVGVFPQVHQQVVLENSLPAGAQISEDGQMLLKNWPVSKDVLRKLGLPMDATEQEFNMFHRADSVKVTPDIAALIARELLQFRQLEHASTHAEAMAYLEQHRPELHKLALKAQ